MDGAPNNNGYNPNKPYVNYWDRSGQHCVNYYANIQRLNDWYCDQTLRYLCEGLRGRLKRSLSKLIIYCECLDVAGLGGALDGYDIEHSGTCSTGFKYEIKTKISHAETGLSTEYLKAFKTNGYLKVWAR